MTLLTNKLVPHILYITQKDKGEIQMLEKFAEIIAEQLHVAPGTDITEETSFKQDLRADSFELMELVMALEDEYGIKIEDDELENFETVGDVINYIKSQGIEE